MSAPITEERKKRVMQLVRPHGTDGLPLRDVAKTMRVSVGVLLSAVYSLRDEGKLECSHPNGHRASRWGLPGTRFAAEERQAVIDAERDSRRAKYFQKLSDAKRRAEQKAMDEELTEFEKPMDQRIISAATAKPLGRVGPRFVFELAEDL
jgi:hypothetical protein